VIPNLRRVLLSIVAVAVAGDCLWTSLQPFDIDVAAYARLAVLCGVLWAGSLYYERLRKDQNLSAMLFGAAFLIAFSAAFSLLNYLLLTVAGGRIDVQLAAMDRWLGFDWPQIMSLAAGHPFENGLLRIIYGLVLPQMAVLIICLGWRKKPQEIYRFCCAVVAGAAMTIAFWAMFPSFGAFSVYELSPSVASRLSLELDSRYAHDLVHMLASGPGRISPHELKGLIGFPSFHAALAGLLIWYAWSVPVLRWPLIVLNSLVFVSTPIQGGHHVVDVVAGIAVAAIAIAATGYLSNWLERRSASAAQHSRAGAALPAGVPSQAFADS